MKERNCCRVVDIKDPRAARIARSTGRDFKIGHLRPVENWFSPQFHPGLNSFNSIRGETFIRVANYAQSARLARGLKAAQLCSPTIFTKRLPNVTADRVTDEIRPAAQFADKGRGSSS